MSTHVCPVPGGTGEVDDDMLLCARHWYTVPKALRAALWAAWRNGKGMGTAEHLAAMKACIRAADTTLTCSGRRMT